MMLKQNNILLECAAVLSVLHRTPHQHAVTTP
jgi:hypothetical protein